jgi:hypothetical protein
MFQKLEQDLCQPSSKKMNRFHHRPVTEIRAFWWTQLKRRLLITFETEDGNRSSFHNTEFCLQYYMTGNIHEPSNPKHNILSREPHRKEYSNSVHKFTIIWSSRSSDNDNNNNNNNND